MLYASVLGNASLKVKMLIVDNAILRLFSFAFKFRITKKLEERREEKRKEEEQVKRKCGTACSIYLDTHI